MRTGTDMIHNIEGFHWRRERGERIGARAAVVAALAAMSVVAWVAISPYAAALFWVIE